MNSRMFVRSPNVKMVARRVCYERLSNHLTAICHFELARFAYIMLIPSFSAHIVRTRTAFLESQTTAYATQGHAVRLSWMTSTEEACPMSPF